MCRQYVLNTRRCTVTETRGVMEGISLCFIVTNVTEEYSIAQLFVCKHNRLFCPRKSCIFRLIRVRIGLIKISELVNFILLNLLLCAFQYYPYNSLTLLLIRLKTHFTRPETLLRITFTFLLMKFDTVFFSPMPPHVLCGLRGPPSWARQECNRLLRLGRP